jgi:hypothetical protein
MEPCEFKRVGHHTWECQSHECVVFRGSKEPVFCDVAYEIMDNAMEILIEELGDVYTG